MFVFDCYSNAIGQQMYIAAKYIGHLESVRSIAASDMQAADVVCEIVDKPKKWQREEAIDNSNELGIDFV